MTTQELEGYKKQLVSLGHRIKGDLSGLAGEALRDTGGEPSGNLSNTPLHMADLGTDAFERDMTMNLLENEAQTFGEVAAALTRIESGSFGQCEECGANVPRERLQALPYVRHCVECARELQGDPAAHYRASGL